MGTLDLGLKILNLGIVLIATVLGYVARFDQTNMELLRRFASDFYETAHLKSRGHRQCDEFVLNTAEGKPEICPHFPSGIPAMENVFVTFVLISLFILILDFIMSLIKPLRMTSVGCLLAALLLLIGGALIMTSATLIDNFFFSSRDHQKIGLSGVVDGNLAQVRRELKYDLKIAGGVLSLMGCNLSLVVAMIVGMSKGGNRQHKVLPDCMKPPPNIPATEIL